MNEIIITESPAIVRPPDRPAGGIKLDGLIGLWLEAKAGRSQSARTAADYKSIMRDFRLALWRVQLDLDPRKPDELDQITMVAQLWAAAGDPPPSPATHNKRLAVVSSFYNYAIKHAGRYFDKNPIAKVDRRPVQQYASAQPLDGDEALRRLAALDRSTLVGARDYCLLSVTLLTGHRLFEIAGLSWGDVQITGNTATLHFRRMKGGKQGHDRLTPFMTRELLAWLRLYYGDRFGSLANDAPLWVSLSNNSEGQRLSARSLANICEQHFGTSKYHAIRHTFARAMEDAGAKVSEIQARLGHSSLQTTGRYLAAIRSAENPYMDALSERFGLVDETRSKTGKKRKR